FLVVEAEGLGLLARLGEALADALAVPARIVVARACTAGAHRARLVVHVLLHGEHGRFALADSWIEPAPGLVEVRGAPEAGRLVLRERQRPVRHVQGVRERVRREGALSGALPVIRGRSVQATEVVVLGDHGRILTHGGEPGRGERVELAALRLAEAGIRDVADQGVLERPLPRSG